MISEEDQNAMLTEYINEIQDKKSQSSRHNITKIKSELDKLSSDRRLLNMIIKYTLVPVMIGILILSFSSVMAIVYFIPNLIDTAYQNMKQEKELADYKISAEILSNMMYLQLARVGNQLATAENYYRKIRDQNDWFSLNSNVLDEMTSTRVKSIKIFEEDSTFFDGTNYMGWYHENVSSINELTQEDKAILQNAAASLEIIFTLTSSTSSLKEVMMSNIFLVTTSNLFVYSKLRSSSTFKYENYFKNFSFFTNEYVLSDKTLSTFNYLSFMLPYLHEPDTEDARSEVITTMCSPVLKKGKNNTIINIKTDLEGLLCSDLEVEAFHQEMKEIVKDFGTSNDGSLTLLTSIFLIDRNAQILFTSHDYNINSKKISDFEFSMDYCQQASTKCTQELIDTERDAFDNAFESLYPRGNQYSFEYTLGGLSYIALTKELILEIPFVPTTQHLSDSKSQFGYVPVYFVLLAPYYHIVQSQQETEDMNIIYLLASIIVIMLTIILIVYPIYRIMRYQAQSVVHPINDLITFLKNIENDQDVVKNFREYSYEINLLYSSFQRLKNVLKIANDAFLTGNDAQALLNYSTALNLYKRIHNNHAMGISYNNVGNLHFINKRYDEAINSFKDSVECAKNDLVQLETKRNQMSHTSIDVKTREEFENRIKEYTESQLNRKYSLCRSYFMKCHQAKKKGNRMTKTELNAFWLKSAEQNNELVKQFQVVDRSNPRIIRCHCMMAVAYVNLVSNLNDGSSEQVYNAKKNLIDAKKMFDEVVNSQAKFKNRETKQKPYEIDALEQFVTYSAGVVELKLGNIQEAARLLTSVLRKGTYYDRNIRKWTLEELGYIFYKFGLLKKTPGLVKLIKKYKNVENRDILLLMDYSESMEVGSKLMHALRSILRLYDDYICMKDRVAFTRFNKECNVIFSLTERAQNPAHTRMQIQESLYPKGTSSVFDAISNSISMLQADEIGNSQWIILYSDGYDNESNTSLSDLLQKIKKSQIHLVIVGIALDPASIQNYKMLCAESREGIFIETADSDALIASYQSISTFLTKTTDPELSIEYM